jgi:head-tail adaptor
MLSELAESENSNSVGDSTLVQSTKANAKNTQARDREKKRQGNETSGPKKRVKVTSRKDLSDKVRVMGRKDPLNLE